MEQERKVEKFLKAYAKKRRGQAGGPFTLDPAARRRLQDEVSRSAPASEDEGETISLWELLRKHWLYLLGFAACIFVMAALFLSTLYAPVSKSFRASSTLSLTKNTRQSSPPMQQPIAGATGSASTAQVAPAPAVAPPMPSVENQNSGQIAAASKGLYLDNLDTRRETREPAQVFSQNVVGSIAITNATVATLTPPHVPPEALSDQALVNSANAPAPESASDELETSSAGISDASRDAAPPGAVAPMRGASSAVRESDNTLSQTSILPTTGIPATAVGGNYAMNSTPVNSMPTRNFGGGGGTRSPLSRKDYLETVASPSQSAAVLLNFQVSKNGNTIRVVDQDGSIYTGALESEGSGQNVTPADTAVLGDLATLNKAALNATTRKSESPKAAQFGSPGGNANKGNDASSAREAISSGVSPATAESPTAAEPQAPMQKYFFYAVGTNQTLKQSVVFAGTLVEDLSLASNAQQTFGMSANAALGAAYAQQFVRSAMTNQPLRIEGVAIIDQTYKIQINAASVPAKNSSPPKK